jgi:DHA1 family bicyclomycin/chloramphenicol resistance-like MFS transporter
VVIIGALSAFGPLSIDMYLPGLPALARDLGGTDWQAQLTLTACLLGLALGQVLVGPLSDAVGRRRPLLAGLAAYALASLACALVPSMALLVLLRFVQGLAGSAGIVLGRAVVRDLYSGDDLARFFALTMAVSGLAPILAPVIGGQLLRVTPWQGVFVVLALIGLALLVSAGLGLGESLPPERRRGGGVRATLAAFRQLLSDRAFMAYALSSGLAFAAMFAYIAGSPFVLEQIYGVSPQTFSLVFAANGLGFVAVSQAGGRLVGRVSQRRLLELGLGLSLAGGLLLVAAASLGLGLPGVALGFFLTVASIGLVAPNSTALALSGHPQIAGSASAFIGVLQYVVGAAITPLVGLLGTGTALPLALLMASLSAAACAVFVGLRVRG